MLEHQLRVLYRDELERLILSAFQIYDGCLAEERLIGEMPSRSAPRL